MKVQSLLRSDLTGNYTLLLSCDDQIGDIEISLLDSEGLIIHTGIFKSGRTNFEKMIEVGRLKHGAYILHVVTINGHEQFHLHTAK
ncbi:MAG: hypothetical protein IPO27_05055 [Bacteroidetes bacterium]|nr:hypothetical protein [Bacteroidota bacterium]